MSKIRVNVPISEALQIINVLTFLKLYINEYCFSKIDIN